MQPKYISFYALYGPPKKHHDNGNTDLLPRSHFEHCATSVRTGQIYKWLCQALPVSFTLFFSGVSFRHVLTLQCR